jgi:ATP-dependent DNA helicase RecQ
MGGQWGRAKLAQVLAGSRDKTLLATGLQSLPTYGLLSALGTPRIRALIDALEDSGCLESVGEEFPKIRITALGRKAMRREVGVELNLPAPPPAKPKKSQAKTRRADRLSAVEAPSDPLLYEALRSLRTELARQHRVPPYLIFSNKTLADLVAAAPADDEELLTVHGIGPAKADRFGPAILKTVAMTKGLLSG